MQRLSTMTGGPERILMKPRLHKEMMSSKPFVFRFDDVEVLEREFTLIKAGKVLTLEPKAFRTLVFLLHNPQRLISKEELLNTVWGDAAVTEGSLTRCIWLLRRKLGDDTRNPRYIATVTTLGYRFVCPVEVEEDIPRYPAPTGFSAAEGRSEPVDFKTRAVGGSNQAKPQDLAGWRLRRWWVVAAAILVLCIVAASWYLHRIL
jgi:DNA-binding winged helix-turn-helix (wHTH) protein